MLPIWNTPAPPDLSSCRAHCPEPSSSQRFNAVDLDTIRGITFFFTDGRLFGVHFHRPGGPCASRTYQRFSNRLRRSIVWIYLPISKGDRMLALGVRQAPKTGLNILARTQLIGDIILGEHIKDGFKDWCLARSSPVTLIYGEPIGELRVPFFGAYCALSPEPPLPRPFPLQRPGPNPIDGYSYFSWAPLDGISSTTTFSDQSTGFCRGIIFQYESGGARAVGQCRLDVDATETVAHPLMLYLFTKRYTSRWNRSHPKTQVQFKHNSQHEQSAQGWECHKLRGHVKFWYTNESSILVVEH